MEKQSLVMTGKTVEEAIELAILELGASRAEVEVDVLSKGRSGILGIGSEPARVRVSLISKAGDNPAAIAIQAVSKMLKNMGVEAQCTIRSQGTGPEDPPIIDIQGADAGLLIGRRGETLQSLQFIVNLVVSKQIGDRTSVVLDVEQYRERRQRNLQTLAQRMADRVVASGRPMTLEPMSAADRRIIHMTLAEHAQVITESSGEGQDRKVTIRLKDGARRRPQGQGQVQGRDTREPQPRDPREPREQPRDPREPRDTREPRDRREAPGRQPM